MRHISRQWFIQILAFGFAISALALSFFGCGLPASAQGADQASPISATPGKDVPVDFAITRVRVERFGANWIFAQTVSGKAGRTIPATIGKLAGAKVESYVWPTSLNSSAVGFEADQGMLALAATSHPDFIDTMMVKNGAQWHSHWVVLVKDESCGGGLKVKDIPEGTTPALPAMWPKLPILIDSPMFPVELNDNEVVIVVPDDAIKSPKSFNFDGVTAELTVNTEVKAPLLCVTKVRDVASVKLTLPGIAR